MTKEADIMNTKLKKLSTLVPAFVLATTTSSLLAETFTVTSPADPVTPQATNCSAAASACTLRDALAAADSTAEPDRIVFDIDEPIYLTRRLTAQTPVRIEGGKNTQLRVHQGYTIATLPDRFTPNIVPVLQPVFVASPGNRYMLDLRASGSSVTNLKFDGSITPTPGETTVERLDINGDDVTDVPLYQGNDEGNMVWLVAGGVTADFSPPWATECGEDLPLGQVEIVGNEFRNLGFGGITVVAYVMSTIADNEIIGGGYPQERWDFDGIWLYCGAATTVSGNLVSHYRNGISVALATAVSLTENELTHNRIGIDIEYTSDLVGPNLVQNNKSSSNGISGMHIFTASALNVFDNEIHENGSDPNENGGILVIGSAWNTIAGNDVRDNSGYGIALDASWVNEVSGNDTIDNGGAGVVLVNDSQQNLVSANRSRFNGAGIVLATTTNAFVFPSNNLIENNRTEHNLAADLGDFDPVCNDLWSNNRFDTLLPQGSACIQ